MSSPTFSILVPTYNQAGFLAQALDSLIAQTDPDWEALVVNDGSTDGTAEVVAGYAARDCRIRGFSQPNGGTGAALNKALSEVRGQWICWLSSDDLFVPEKLARHRVWFSRCPDARFFFTYFQLHFEKTGQRETRHDLWGPLPARRYQTLGLFFRNFISGITICVHREAFADIGPFDTSLRYGQDYDRWLWLTARYPGVFIPEWTVVNRNHAGQGSEVFPAACYYDTAKAAIRFIGTRPFEELVPLADTSRFDEALDALSAALDTAAAPDAFLYCLGFHSGLLFSIYDFVSRRPGQDERQALWHRVETVAARHMFEHCGAFGAMWREAWLTARLGPVSIDREGITPLSAAIGHHRRLLAGDPAQVQALERYFLQYMGQPAPAGAGCELYGLEAAVVTPGGASDEARHAMEHGAKLLASAGASVLVVEEGESGIACLDGMTALHADDVGVLAAAAVGMRPLDVCLVWEDTPPLPAARVVRLGSAPTERGYYQVPTSHDRSDDASTVLIELCAPCVAPTVPVRGLASRVRSFLHRRLNFYMHTP